MAPKGSEDVANKPRKRPDVVQRLKDRKGKQERVVKCSLQKVLTEKHLMPEIQKWVVTTSKITQKGSLVFNKLLLHCLNRDLNLPDLTDQTLYLQCFNVGSGRLNKSIPSVKDVWGSYFKDFPKIEKNKGDTQAYVYSSKQYMTNFKTSLVYTFEGRQKHYISKWCKEHSIDKEQCHAIRCAVNRWNCKTEVKDEVKDFIMEQQALLGNTEELHLTWLGSHMENVVRYFYHILTYLEQFEDERLFTLAPICSIKSHYLTIDTTVLYEMLKNLKHVNCEREVFIELKKEQFESIFNLKGLCSGEFGYMVETDGVSACFHFKVPSKIKTLGNRALKKEQRVIAIDPGRCNLIYGVEKLEDDKLKTYRLTRASYYTKAGMKKFNKKSAGWEKTIEKEELIFRRHSLKTAKEEEWKSFLEDYISVYDALWDCKTKKKWGRERFSVYGLKRKTLDRFFQTMENNENVKPVIAYGAAKFNPNSTHELSAPTTFLSKRCSKHFSMVLIDEYNTTKVCSCCDEKLLPVVKDGLEIRGLRWCGSFLRKTKSFSTKCRTFLNRDLNAALNILRCFESQTNRPQHLSRNSGKVKGGTTLNGKSSFYLSNKAR